MKELHNVHKFILNILFLKVFNQKCITLNFLNIHKIGFFLNYILKYWLNEYWTIILSFCFLSLRVFTIPTVYQVPFCIRKTYLNLSNQTLKKKVASSRSLRIHFSLNLKSLKNSVEAQRSITPSKKSILNKIKPAYKTLPLAYILTNHISEVYFLTFQ